ncbi:MULTISPECIES: ATP-binding protein [Bradyrhizobium]|jgi:signal transduction histidine kinase/ActR/RegA family two-component response regulator|uniref:histidine kinase n=1 Tax=Bradyrhizobium ottawaense TaxID=931866 RepID=A0A2U8P9U7_9BRAD|nr:MULTISPECIES: ATP-binding protein [Bradyrhizobium]AWL94523.1 hybrid sensor histidine kinase/response regulator [Bradyrhizobium ottawaense]MBR1289409.1 response regulator [Bradyrhizobium ottawaense]MBR1326977.1 response regulator [Bradyrhizobium ottawaense]MBR1331353.1 response regulator [Bradyrhizobium ottawaense]MBR1361902.1 response regulator [Bradyrhizobium ottawaense]
MSLDPDHRVLVFAPIGRDGPASTELFRGASLEAVNCRDLSALVSAMTEGVGAVFLAEEGLFGRDTAPLAQWIERQPPWSDLPFVVLTSHREQPAVVAWRRSIVELLRNVSLLERPVQPITLTSAIQSAIRARRRQYEIRALLEAREQTAQELEKLVVERTRELKEANEQLRLEMNERARVEETLRQAQKIEAIGQLTGGVAHDFNNLLMVISGGLDMLDRQTDPNRRRRLMDGMIQAAQRGASLTKQLLAFSRRQKLRPEPVDVAAQIGGMRELLDRSLRGDVHVEFEFPDSLWPVEVDPGELELVILNLAVNARDAMPNGGTILVRGENLPELNDAEIAGDYVRLSVIDTGVGMAPEILSRVFEPFFTTKDVGKGSGLGLAQVHGFATQSRGTVRIQSEAGRGTSIELYLPRSFDVPSSERHLIDLTRVRPKKSNQGRILLVEDDDEVAALVAEMLGQLGYEVTRAASAAAALGALADGRSVDVIFSDIMMPGGMNGVELAHEIKRRRNDIPVLLTSGYAEASVHEAQAAGIQILAKPYHIDELSAALSAARSSLRLDAGSKRSGSY